jgi:hypothetical protein
MRNRTKRKIARIVCGTSALFILGVVGGIERSLPPLGEGALWLIIGFVVFVISGLKGGVIK